MTSQSDDEIFFNKVTIRNTRKFLKKRKCCSTRFEGLDDDNSVKIIETSSEPDLSSRIALDNSISSVCSDFDKSLLHIEKIVADYELRYKNTYIENGKSKKNLKGLDIKPEVLYNHNKEKYDVQNRTSKRILLKDGKDKIDETDSFSVHTTPKLNDSILKTSRKEKLKRNYINVQKNPTKCNLFEHITSPVAMYIKQSPQVPLLQNVKPEKPLTHSIPDLPNGLRKNSRVEYKPLPSVAYKCARNTKVIEIPDESKLPQCQWAKKLIATLPEAVVIKHVERKNVMLSRSNESKTDNSFADLTLHQAKLSICTSQNAYNIKNKNL